MSDWSAIVEGVAKSFADLGWSNAQLSNAVRALAKALVALIEELRP